MKYLALTAGFCTIIMDVAFFTVTLMVIAGALHSSDNSLCLLVFTILVVMPAINCGAYYFITECDTKGVL